MSSFDDYAKDWDTDLKINRSNSVIKAIEENIELNKDMNVLDFGCGTGLLILPLVNKVNTLHGIDLSPNMLEVLDSKAIKYPNITSELVGIFEITSTYDLIMSSMVMHHIDGTPKLAKKLYDSLNPNGIIAIADLMEEDGSFHSSLEGVYSLGYSDKYLIDTFKSAGFKEISIVKNIFNMEKHGKTYPLLLLIAKK